MAEILTVIFLTLNQSMMFLYFMVYFFLFCVILYHTFYSLARISIIVNILDVKKDRMELK